MNYLTQNNHFHELFWKQSTSIFSSHIYLRFTSQKKHFANWCVFVNEVDELFFVQNDINVTSKYKQFAKSVPSRIKYQFMTAAMISWLATSSHFFTLKISMNTTNMLPSSKLHHV